MTKLFRSYRFHLLAAILLVFSGACQKDRFLPASSVEGSQLHIARLPISVDEARRYFQELGELKPVALNSLEEKVYLGSVTPDWANAFLGTAITGQEMAIAPLLDNKLSELNQGRTGIKLLFAKVGTDRL